MIRPAYAFLYQHFPVYILKVRLPILVYLFDLILVFYRFLLV